MSSTGALRVCVIGAGAAGLCACRHLSGHDINTFVPTVFEQTDNVGGTWVYTESVGLDSHGLPVHSSMYKNLKTNLPKEVMAFPDFPFKASIQSFLPHNEVRGYLQDYCDNFGLEKFIQFGTRIKNVKPIKTDKKVLWEVTSELVDTKESSTSIFDAVMVCNGHYSVPNIPDVSNMDQFAGLRMHSHNYRTPDPFSNLRVVLLGAAASGTDISLEIATKAKQVLLSHNGPKIPSKLPDNLVQVAAVVSFQPPSSFHFSDGSMVEADAILFCTGYKFTFPFLDPTCNVNVASQQVAPLFKHVIHTEFPSLCFIGIPFQVCPFPQFDLQVRLFLKTLTGEVVLPSETEMNKDTEEERHKKAAMGIAERHLHKMGELQWAYNRELAIMAGVEGVPLTVETLYNDVTLRRRGHLTSYKEDVYEFVCDKFVRLEE